MTTHTQRHTARPSRVRVALARVIGALNRAYDYAERHIVAVALALATLASVTLALLVAFSENRYGVAVCALAFCASVAFFVFVATDEAVARQRDAYWRARTRGILATHDEQREYWNTYCDQVAQRNEERLARVLAERDEARATIAQHEQDARDYREREQRRYQEQCEQRARGAREFRITLNAPRYYDERQSVLATISDGVRSIDCGGRAYYDGKKSGAQVRREAFYDALEDACLKLTSASASLIAEDDHLSLSVSPTVVRMMPTFSENE